MSNVEKPSDKIIKAANEVQSVTDSLGRVIRFKRLNAVDKMRAFAALPASLSSNMAYLGFAFTACMVTEIDGVPMPTPRTQEAIEAVVARLDDEGMDAISTALNL